MESDPHCPSCGKETTLCLIHSSSGKVWADLACAPCSYAMENGIWRFFAGGTRLKSSTKTATL